MAIARETHLDNCEPKDITWRNFRALDEKLFPLEVCKTKELEIEKFVQKNMAVADYEAKFTCLQRFSPGFVATEK